MLPDDRDDVTEYIELLAILDTPGELGRLVSYVGVAQKVIMMWKRGEGRMVGRQSADSHPMWLRLSVLCLGAFSTGRLCVGQMFTSLATTYRRSKIYSAASDFVVDHCVST